MKSVLITGTGLFTPSQRISNEELVQSFNTWVEGWNHEQAAAIAAGSVTAKTPSSAEFIEKASGIKSRFVMDRDGVLDPQRMKPHLPERSNDEPCIQAEMAVAAAREALAQSGLQGSDIDLVILACSNPQRAYPAVAIEVQQLLGAQGFAYDMNVACSSATFGIQAGCSAIQSGQARRVLMVNPEICSAHLNFRDRDSHFIFGDACTAVILEAAELAVGKSNVYEVFASRLMTQFSNNIRNNAGFLNRCDEAGLGKDDKLFVQEGRKVFKEVCPMVAEMIVEQLAANQLQPEQLSRLWLHQANLNMNQLIARRVLGRDATPLEAPVILDRYANTSSAGSIIAFHLHRQDLQTGDLGVICSFGAGYSAGCLLVRKVA
ncbi:beta-ketoacyl-ACP synthase III [Marinospirillum alkaliphilum]|uniref:Beta-ketodecanoyl-[acyl-carrier-protein] synthase n=1 Tax=Marinospirillum alkaliphilum DSM 21637 TaxID=1122209 RepID=A0A1K1TYP3_9GAMM|nr:beta-ketoacyl-ACP synthase III [Marinospirillum alkaliphilum]SFX05791.1 beta-ketodecanoyl-[acyl-carrier-protein] synthase [Marinospirillum alkaliphilum DSM 21637]